MPCKKSSRDINMSTSESPVQGRLAITAYPALSALCPYLINLFNFKLSFIAKQISYWM
jgi:hypothetical protein